MHAGLVESQQKNRTLRDSLRATERQLELARKTIERLSNERTLIEAASEADRARMKKLERTLETMRSLSGTKARDQGNREKVRGLMEELSAAEERADAEHQLAEVRRQEVNILKRALRLRDEELADGCRHSMQDQLSDCPLQSIARAQHLQPASKELQLALVVERDAQLPSNTTENDIFEDPLDIPPAAGSADDCRSESLLAEIKTLREDGEKLKEDICTSNIKTADAY
ncbi:hypothetical protein WJX75_009216 [Coccomyxa subellipsoidea]|uniref:Uncharacterized protein n=1 Tax=Coccomyxa subellipsoidea TaxID=248742 RepID=A0ABR2YKA4_9CHLO